MAIHGIHLTRIGRGNFLLEPLSSLNLQEIGVLLQEIVTLLQQGRGSRLYYDLSELPVIDQVYYDWLDKLARVCLAVNVRMVCINMQPTAAFALAKFIDKKPVFETASVVPDEN